MIKIGLVGSSDVGKTTLANKLKEKLNDSIIISEQASKYGEIGLKDSLEKELIILNDQMSEELKAINKAKYVICDRTLYDNYVYMHLLFHNKLNTVPVEDYMKYFLRKYNYDYVFKLPLNGSFKTKKENNSISEEFRKKVDDEIDKLLKRFNVKLYIKLNTKNDVTDYIDDIISILNNIEITKNYNTLGKWMEK